jgi:TPP-dependent pyruvate/acetoin dehydrogenase alpha subunit
MTTADTALGWQFLTSMLRMRRFEEAVGKLGADKSFPGHYHLYIGQEATGAGAMAALRPEDKIATTHRNHGHLIARGADPNAALAEILGRETGLNRGRGGTLHVCDPSLGFLQTSAIVGSVLGLAAGAGYAIRQLGGDAVVGAFFGDGALEEGIAFEALNIAALWKLPVVFICENNNEDSWGMAAGGYPMLIHAAHDLRSIPGSLGIEATRVDGVDPLAVYQAVALGAERCCKGAGPVFIEAMTRRWAGSAPLWPVMATGTTDIGMALGETALPDNEHHEWFALQDPVLRLARGLDDGAPAQERIRALDAAARAEMQRAAQFALASPFPAAETAADYLFAT